MFSEAEKDTHQVMMKCVSYKDLALRVIAIINQKGGCGKTTTAINLASSFAKQGQRAVLVDMDPQSHCALGLAVPESRLDGTIVDALLSERPEQFDLGEVLWQIAGGLYLVPSSVALAGAEQKLAKFDDRDLRLSKCLKSIAGDFDVAVIDCPPSVGLLTFNALRAADDVIIPVETGFFALQGSIKQAATLEVLAEKCDHHVRIHVLPTMYDVRMKVSREILAEMKRYFGSQVVSVPIHFNAKLKEAASYGQPITEYDPSGRGCEDFEQLASWLVANNAPVVKRERAKVAPEVTEAEKVEETVMPAVVSLTDMIEVKPVSEVLGGESVEMMVGSGVESIQNSVVTPKGSHAVAGGTTALPKAGGGGVVNEGNSGGLSGGGEVPRGAGDVTVGLSRAAELVQRAKALAKRTDMMHERFANRREFGNVAVKEAVKPSRSYESVYGVRVTNQGVLFVQPDAAGIQRICIAGDFNGWSDIATPLQRNAELGVWESCIPLPSGRYGYRLVVNGVWQNDSHNNYVEANPYGELNNIVEV